MLKNLKKKFWSLISDLSVQCFNECIRYFELLIILFIILCFPMNWSFRQSVEIRYNDDRYFSSQTILLGIIFDILLNQSRKAIMKHKMDVVSHVHFQGSSGHTNDCVMHLMGFKICLLLNFSSKSTLYSIIITQLKLIQNKKTYCAVNHSYKLINNPLTLTPPNWMSSFCLYM